MIRGLRSLNEFLPVGQLSESLYLTAAAILVSFKSLSFSRAAAAELGVIPATHVSISECFGGWHALVRASMGILKDLAPTADRRGHATQPGRRGRSPAAQ